MTKNELIELTKVDMTHEEIPMLESENYTPDEVEFTWEVEDLPNDTIQITMETRANGEYVNSKARKIHLLEE